MSICWQPKQPSKKKKKKKKKRKERVIKLLKPFETQLNFNLFLYAMKNIINICHKVKPSSLTISKLKKYTKKLEK